MSHGVAPVLTPRGRLILSPVADAPPLEPVLARRLQAAFERGSGHGLLHLGAREVETALPPALGFWRAFAARYMTALCTLPDAEGRDAAPVPAPSKADLEATASAAPPMEGAEYLTAAVLGGLWDSVDGAFEAEIAQAGVPVQDFLKSCHMAWNLVGRVYFNLAENRRDEEAPFAFLATYSTRLSAQGKAQHVPLGQALREYAGAADRERLLSLLLPVQRASEACPWLKDMVDAGEVFHPLRWTPAEAFRFLGDIPALERAGVIVRMPATWPGSRPARPLVTATVGGKAPAGLGQDALLDFRLELTLDGEKLDPGEIADLLAQTAGLALIRGRWVEVDGERLKRLLARFREAERRAAKGGLAFGEAMRLLSGAGGAEDGPASADWSRVTAGPWLAEALQGLRSPQGLARVSPGEALQGSLRPYQEVGVRWLYLLSRLGLGGCLADDMGLGKTIQVLALLLLLKASKSPRPSLLVAPASLLANWTAEIERFAPTLRVRVAHPSAAGSSGDSAVNPGPAANPWLAGNPGLAVNPGLAGNPGPAANPWLAGNPGLVVNPGLAGNPGLSAESLAGIDLVITSYGQLLRLPALAAIAWDLLILDEAQAIKNPGAKQTQAAKKLSARARLALSGTPIENRTGDLWSLFDFLNPGLLGSASDFATLIKRLSDRPVNPFGPLRDLVRPYILRRLKTDKSVIADLPDKTEVKAYCHLGRKQAVLYQQAVAELRERLADVDGIRRKGVILSFLMRFKQICNHPSQWLGDGAWAEEDSGKWARLRDIADVVAARQEKVLVFTQFREVTEPLATLLGSVFGRTGPILHGGTPVKKRQELVRQFQEDEAVPFFVLSLKAGGSGLNLTAANHVVHFDRWWNPAVEDQATDRAFRIGQRRNVMVHKFLCRGTLEEKIDALIESKRKLSHDLLEGGADPLLTELDDAALLDLVALDINAALKEA